MPRTTFTREVLDTRTALRSHRGLPGGDCGQQVHLRAVRVRIRRLGAELVLLLAILVEQVHDAVGRHDCELPAVRGPGREQNRRESLNMHAEPDRWTSICAPRHDRDLLNALRGAEDGLRVLELNRHFLLTLLSAWCQACALCAASSALQVGVQRQESQEASLQSLVPVLVELGGSSDSQRGKQAPLSLSRPLRTASHRFAQRQVPPVVQGHACRLQGGPRGCSDPGSSCCLRRGHQGFCGCECCHCCRQLHREQCDGLPGEPLW